MLIVLIVSFRTEAQWCSFPPGRNCQIAEGTTKNGEVVFKSSYCSGDFPYCETFGGNCCSEPSPDNWGCCDQSIHTKHEVGTLTPSGSRMAVQLYKCCSKADYGENAVWYKDANEKVHCCGGRLYLARETDKNKSCCGNEISNGEVVRYWAVAEVEGSPDGEVEKICCSTKGEAPGEYKQTAYWDGYSAVCCDGKTYKRGEENYGCCTGSKGNNKTHKVTTVLGAPNGEEACCDIETYGTSPEAYWNGSTAVCCQGEIYKNGVDEKGNTEYACCSGDTSENPTDKKVSVSGAPNGEEVCCDIATYGASPTAYWNGSSGQCCKGKATPVLGSPNNEYTCCDAETYGSNPTAYWNGSSSQCCKGTVGNADGELICCEEGTILKKDPDGKWHCCRPEYSFAFGWVGYEYQYVCCHPNAVYMGCEDPMVCDNETASVPWCCHGTSNDWSEKGRYPEVPTVKTCDRGYGVTTYSCATCPEGTSWHCCDYDGNNDKCCCEVTGYDCYIGEEWVEIYEQGECERANGEWLPIMACTDGCC